MLDKLLVNRWLQEGSFLEMWHTVPLENFHTMEVQRVWEEEYQSYVCQWNIFNRALLQHYRQSQWPKLYDCFCTKKCCLKAHQKSKFIPKTFLFFAPGAYKSAGCCHFKNSLEKLWKHFGWLPSSGLNKWNEWLQMSLFLFWLSISWYHIHPTQTSTDWIVTVLIGKQWCILSLNFQKKKGHIDEQDVKLTLIVTKDWGQTHELSKILVLYKPSIITSIQSNSKNL